MEEVEIRVNGAASWDGLTAIEELCQEHGLALSLIDHHRGSGVETIWVRLRGSATGIAALRQGLLDKGFEVE